MAGSREAMAAREMVEGREVGTVAVVAPGRAGDGDSLEVKGATAELDSGSGSGSAVENVGATEVGGTAADVAGVAASVVGAPATAEARGTAGVGVVHRSQSPRCADAIRARPLGASTVYSL